MVSNTNGISAPWHAPSRWLSSGSGRSKRYIQVPGVPAAARASATRMAGMRKNQSLITAASRSPGLASVRLARWTARSSSDRPYAPATAPSPASSIRSMLAAATRNSRASSRFDPISNRTPLPEPRAADEAAAGRADKKRPGLVGVRSDQRRDAAALARGECRDRRRGQDRAVDGRRERQQAQRELPPLGRIGGGRA